MRIYRPRIELQPYVRYYWTLECDDPFEVLTFPIGCPQLIFHRKTPFYIPELGQSQDRFSISGQVNFPAHLRSDGNLDMIVAVFRPHIIGMFIDTSPSEFYNIEISGYDLGNRFLNDVAARIFDCGSTARCVQILEEQLMTRIRAVPDFRRVSSALDRMLAQPSVTVNALADTACLGKKQFGRVFRSLTGMNPKEYARIVRFQKSLRFMQCGRRDHAAVAADCGYADQSHYIREFRDMSGLTPQAFLRQSRPYSDLYTDPV